MSAPRATPDIRASTDGKRGTVLVMALILFVAGLLLRLDRIGDADFSGDETDLWRYVVNGVPSPQEPPLPRILTRLWLDAVGHDGNAVVRLPAAFAGALTVVATLFLGRALAGLSVGVFAAFVLCVHPFAIVWSQRLRPYGILGLLTVCSLLAYVEARRRRHLRGLLLLSAALTLTTASHALGALVVGALFVDSAFRVVEKALRDGAWLQGIQAEARLGLSAASGLLGLGWTLFRPNVTSVATRTRFSRLPAILGDIFHILSGALLAPGRPLGLVLTTLTLGAALIGAARLWRDEEKRDRGGRAVVLCGSVIILVVAATLGPKAGFGAREWSRYVSNVLPLVAIAVGTALSVVTSARPRAALAAVGIAVASAPSLGGWNQNPTSDRFLSKFAANVKAQEEGLRGILIVGQYWWVDRWTMNYFRLRRDSLPGYAIAPGQAPRQVEALPRASPVGSRLVVPFGDRAGPMPSGVYAVISQSSGSCEALLRIAPLVRSSRPAANPAPGPRGRTGFCEVEFVSPP